MVTADHIICFLGMHIGRMLQGFLLVRREWSTRESYNAIPAAKEAMPRGDYEDIFCCFHFVDDWEDDDDGDEYDNDKSPVTDGTAKHLQKHGSLKEAH